MAIPFGDPSHAPAPESGSPRVPDAGYVGTSARRFEEFYLENYGPVAVSVACVCSDADLALEATDEAFARAFVRWDRVEKMASPRGWTTAVAVNLCKRGGLRLKRRRETEARFIASQSGPISSGPAAEFYSLIAKLPRRERQAIALRYVADLTQKDIAHAMGIRRSTVGVLLSRAHKRLADGLRDQTGRSPDG